MWFRLDKQRLRRKQTVSLLSAVYVLRHPYDPRLQPLPSWTRWTSFPVININKHVSLTLVIVHIQKHSITQRRCVWYQSLGNVSINVLCVQSRSPHDVFVEGAISTTYQRQYPPLVRLVLTVLIYLSSLIRINIYFNM